MSAHVGSAAGLAGDAGVVGLREGIALACAESLAHPIGSGFVYSDINYIVLGEVVRVASGKTLDVYTRDAVFGPLKMVDSGFLPPAAKLSRIAPTEIMDGKLIHGVVHDPTSRRMGGVAGHAGLFTTAADLARFCRMLLNGGELEGVRVLSAASVAEMTRVQNDGNDRRGLGWDIDSRYSGPRGKWFPAGASFGHTGWTGTSLWIDPTSRSFMIFLANRVHPDGKGDVTRCAANSARWPPKRWAVTSERCSTALMCWCAMTLPRSRGCAWGSSPTRAVATGRAGRRSICSSTRQA
jgi:CubicO group peptidase (beta-lactamase class C family)